MDDRPSKQVIARNVHVGQYPHIISCKFACHFVEIWRVACAAHDVPGTRVVRNSLGPRSGSFRKTGVETRRLRVGISWTNLEPFRLPSQLKAYIRPHWVMNVTNAQCSGMMSTRRIFTRAANLLSRSYGQAGLKVSCGNGCVSQMPRSQALPMTQSRGKAPLSLTRTWASAADSVAIDEQTGVLRFCSIFGGLP